MRSRSKVNRPAPMMISDPAIIQPSTPMPNSTASKPIAHSIWLYCGGATRLAGARADAIIISTLAIAASSP